MKNFVLALIFVFILGSGAAAVDPLTYPEFLEELPRLMREHRVPGMTVTMVHDGEVVDVLAFGVQDTAAADPVTESTLFQAGALSKSLAGWGMLAFFADQGIALDTVVTDLVAEQPWPADPAWADVTLLHLMSHTSGLAGIGYSGQEPGTQLPDVEAGFSGDLPGYAPLRFSGELGSYQYTSAGFAVLQYVVEELSGQPFAAVMDEYLVQPLELPAATFVQESAAEFASGHGFYGKTLPAYRFAEAAAVGGSASAADWAPFLKAHFAENPVLDEAQREFLFAVQTPEATHSALYARQLFPDETAFFAQSGANRGYRSFLALLPDQRSGIVIMTNSDRGHFLIQEAFPAWVGVVTGQMIVSSPVPEMIVWFISVVLGILSVVALYRHLRHLPRRLPARPLPLFLTMTLWPLILGLGWLWFWHTDYFIRRADGVEHYLPVQFMPKNFHVLTGAILVFCFIQFVFTVVRQLRGSSVSAVE